MPHYQYKGFDQQGHTKTGVIEAVSANEAVGLVARMGVRVQNVTPFELTRPVSNVVTEGPLLGTATGAMAVASGSARVETPAGKAQYGGTMGQQETMFLRDQDLFIFFAQLANLLRSGISATEAMTELGRRQSVKPFVQRACTEIAKMTSNGMSLADAMEKYPSIFPPGAIGGVRAGEYGGYLPMACEVFSQNQQTAYKIRLWLFWVGLAIWTCVVLPIPFFNVAMNGTQRLMDTINNQKAPLQEFFGGLGSGLVGVWGILGLAMIPLMFVGWRWTGRPQYLMLRHKLAATVWGSPKKRAMADSLQMFGYHMEALSRAGISPQKIFTLSADAVPNRYVAESLKRVVPGSDEKTKLSTLLYQAEMFPQEYTPLIETGELTGTTESAIGSIVKQSGDDRKFAENWLRFKSFIWIGLIILGSSALFFGFFTRGFYNQAWDAVFQDVPGYEGSKLE